MLVLWSTPHTRIEHDGSAGIIRITRTAAPSSSAAALLGEIESLSAALAGVERSRLGLLMDLRQAPLRSGDDFDDGMARFQQQVRGFARVALLVQTAVGKLQMRRLGGSTSERQQVFDDEHAALAFARGPANRRMGRLRHRGAA